LNKLIDANIEALDQALEVVASLSDASYRDRVNDRSQPGAHIRHVLDHYHALMDGFKSGQVDYDHRRRLCDIETDRALAQAELLATRSWLASLDPVSKPVSVTSEVSLCECCSVTLESDQARELLYTLNHTVHHMAYVALLLQLNGISVNASIGVAPATASNARSRLAS